MSWEESGWAPAALCPPPASGDCALPACLSTAARCSPLLQATPAKGKASPAKAKGTPAKATPKGKAAKPAAKGKATPAKGKSAAKPAAKKVGSEESKAGRGGLLGGLPASLPPTNACQGAGARASHTARHVHLQPAHPPLPTHPPQALAPKKVETKRSAPAAKKAAASKSPAKPATKPAARKASARNKK